MGDLRVCTIDKFKGDSLNSISFTSSKDSRDNESIDSRHLSNNGSFIKYIAAHPVRHSHLFQPLNPNKAFVTVNVRTSEILTGNTVANFLLGIEDNSFPKKLSDFIYSSEDQYLFSEADLQPNGELVVFSGRVMDLMTSKNGVIPVSMWARQVPADDDLRCLVVMEAVERTTGVVQFDTVGNILSCDTSFAILHGYHDAQDVISLNISDLVPSIDFDVENNHGDLIPKGGIKQCATGKRKDGSHFPLTIKIELCKQISGRTKKDLQDNSTVYEGVVWVFNNVSGLVTLLPDLSIHSCNTNFSMILFGYSQNELVGKNISMLIPTFYEDVEFLDTDSVALPPFDEEDDSNAKCGASDGRTTADSVTDQPRPCNPMGKPIELMTDDTEAFPNLSFISPSIDSQVSDLNHVSLPKECLELKDLKTHFPSSSKEAAENEEFSPSCGHSSRQLSCSESQDTLHSGTNSITESDINANVFESPEAKDVLNEIGLTDAEIPIEEPQYECDSFESESEDSDSAGENFSSSDEEIEQYGLSPCKSKLHISRDQKSPCMSDRVSNSLSYSAKNSTPRERSQKDQYDDSFQSLPEGAFPGLGRHRDGTDIAIEYYIKKVVLQDGKHLYCLWISRDPEDINIHTPISKSKHKTACSETSEVSLMQSEVSGASTDSLLLDTDYISGTFSKNYTILQHIGKGAFGCIKKAYRNHDGLLVIAKFIRKSEVYKDSWVFDNEFKKKVPLEISLLTTINHPNIVKVLDVYENEQCFQMVMEKHGSGMDLFEFIEREPILDERLTSYLFRQMVSALKYLHDLNILHRDLKDENIIINHRFHVKLIDFGSAAFMGEGLFSTFCGTMEYCSPEVIQGNKYRGPELEMFALGVTLYTLVFGENPFVGADEILEGKIVIPKPVSEELNGLIHHLLEPNPVRRCMLNEVVEHSWVRQPIFIDDYNFADVIKITEEELNPPVYINVQEQDPQMAHIENEMASLELDGPSEGSLEGHKTSSESDAESFS